MPVQNVENAQANEIITTPFHSIIFDTTISRINQLRQIYSYFVFGIDENGPPKVLVIKKSFLGFHEVKDESALMMSNQIIYTIHEWQKYSSK